MGTGNQSNLGRLRPGPCHTGWRLHLCRPRRLEVLSTRLSHQHLRIHPDVLAHVAVIVNDGQTGRPVHHCGVRRSRDEEPVGTTALGQQDVRPRRELPPVIRLRTHNLCVSEGSLSQGSLQPMLQQHMGDLPAVVEQFSGALPLRRDSSLLHPGKSRSKTRRASE